MSLANFITVAISGVTVGLAVGLGAANMEKIANEDNIIKTIISGGIWFVTVTFTMGRATNYFKKE